MNCYLLDTHILIWLLDDDERQINILPIDVCDIKTLEKLPILEINEKKHADPFDRLLISQAIAGKFVLISSDSKFPFYKVYGLKLLVNEK